MQIKEYHLSNGIPVLCQHYDAAVASLYWWVQVGSADETSQELGFAHFLEHMLFKDANAKETGTASTGKMARMIESLGGEVNAYTSFDQTVYHVTCAAQHWSQVLKYFGEMAQPQKFLQIDFDREREVILEEVRKNEDSPNRQLFQALFSKTFHSHPYGRPVIGTVENLKQATVAQLESFYHQHYVAHQMGLVLVGPLQSQEDVQPLLKLLESHFGGRQALTVKKQARPQEPIFRTDSEWVVRSFDVKTPTVAMSFRIPELTHEDMPALDLLVGILGMGELSRLYQRLFNQKALVTDAAGGLYAAQNPGMLYFELELSSAETLLEVVQESIAEFQKMKVDPIRSDEIARVVMNLESERLYASQTADGIASRLGFLKFTVKDLWFDQNYFSRLRAVSVANIQEIAKKYLDPRRMSGVVLMPKDQTLDCAPLQALVKEQLSVWVERPIHKKNTSQLSLEQWTLPSGIRVCFNPRPTSHVVSLHASVLGGVRLEEYSGMGHFMGLSWTKGTTTKNAQEIAALIEGEAAHCHGFSGFNSTGLQMTGLARSWDLLSRLFLEVLWHPVFPEEEVEHVRRIVTDLIHSREDHSSQVCSQLFLQTLYETHPYGRFIYGSLESVASIRSEALRAFHSRWIRPERLVISVSGAVQLSAFQAWLDQLEKGYVTSLSPEEHPVLQDEPILKAPRWIEKSMGREQCHLMVGGLGTRMDAADRFVMRLLQTLLGGQSGRLFLELREEKSLAYSVSPLMWEGLERGYLATYLACAPQKRLEAIEGIHAVWEQLAKKGLQDAELKRAQEFFLGRRAMDLQSDGALAGHYGLETLYGVETLSEAALAKQIRAISVKQIQSMSDQYWMQSALVTSTVI